MYFVKNRPVDLPCRKADPWYACRYNFYTLLQTRKISWLVKEEKIQWKSNMSYTLFVTAWPFFLLTWRNVYSWLSLLEWYAWLWGLVKPDWCGQAALRLFMYGCLFVLKRKTSFSAYILATIIHNLPNELLEWQYQGIRYYLLLSTPGTPYFSNMKHLNINFSVTLARYFSESLRVHFWWRRLGQKNTTKCKSKTRLLPWTWRSFSMKCYSRGPEWQGS